MNRSSPARKEETAHRVKVVKRSVRKEASEVNPEPIRKIKLSLYAALAILMGGDFFVHQEQAGFIGESAPGFSALFALAATVLIIFVSKFLGHGLVRPENYYGGRHD